MPEIVGVRKIGSDVRDAEGPALEGFACERFRETAAEDETDVRICVRMLRNKEAGRVANFSQSESIRLASVQRSAVKLSVRHA
jgi:hypothetical protein